MSAFEQVIEKLDWEKSQDGLVPAVIQHSSTGVVLMVAWMNREAFHATIEKGRVTFYSRTRKELWTKGDTSGNHLEFVSLAIDCDGDTILVQALPSGPVCHTGQATCFGESNGAPYGFLGQLQATIDQRTDADPDSSYTAQLLQGPFHRAAQKVGEEAVETILAASCRDNDSMIDESADLIYHLMVMLAARGERMTSVIQRLQDRHTR